jgi:choline kinase
MVRGLVLAAGRGSRMGNATEDKPKCLNQLDGRTLLDWQLTSLDEAGIEQLLVVRGYLKEMLVGEYGVVNNLRWNETNMVSSLFCASAFKGDTIISYSDIAYKAQHIIDLKESKGDITITADKKWLDLWELRFEDPLDDAESFKSDGSKLLEIGGEALTVDEIEAQFMGLIKLTAKGWRIMKAHFDSFSAERKDKMDMTTMLNELLKNNVSINVVFINGGWCEADSYEDILLYEKALTEIKNWSHDWR